MFESVSKLLSYNGSNRSRAAFKRFPFVFWRSGVTTAALVLGATLLVSGSAFAQDATADLSSETMEQLSGMQITVSSFARKNEDLWRTPAAVFVISKEDIAQSAATTIPELLRVVPGLQVAQINASAWAVTARGFNSEYASKLLVLVDGRTVYSEIYSGAHWDQIDLPLEMIERIEVIRGPGAAVWGTNAVNGVINIITKPARDTSGKPVSGHVGRIDEVATAGYQGTLGDRTRYRVYGRYIDRRPFELVSGEKAFDGAGTWRGGGRIDWKKNSSDSITTSGDIYKGHIRTQLGPGAAAGVAEGVAGAGQDFNSMSGGFILSRWEHKTEGTETALQVYYDEQSRDELDDPTRTRTTDLDFQSHHRLGDRHDVVWGSEFRLTADHLGAFATQPDYRNYLVNGFFQDQIALVPRRLILTLGSKIQTGSLSGFQVQPSARLLFASSESQSMWMAVSRAAVAPSLQDKYIRFPLALGFASGLPFVGLVQGTASFKSETVVAYEAGYRRRLAAHLSLDIAGFFNNSHRIQSFELDGIAFVLSPPHLLASMSYRNGFRAKSGGVETAVAWKPLSSLNLHGSYTWMEARTTQVTPGSVGILNAFNAPRNAFTGSASWSINKHWELDGLASRVGSMPTNPPPAFDPSHPSPIGVVPAYTRLDAHLTRKFGDALQLSIAGTNLQSPRHLEFDAGTGYITPAYVPRSVSLRGSWVF